MDMEAFISTLPLETGWAPVRMRKYQNFWIPEMHLPAILDLQRHFQVRRDDIFVLSHPKSGTTWLKALSFATMTRGRHCPEDQPLLTLNPHDCVPFLERSLSRRAGQQSKEAIEAMPSPRLLNTHLPFSLLPESIRTADSGCRLIYICRDPKDVLISRWHFNNRISTYAKGGPVPLDKAFEMYCEGVVPYGPVWEHVAEYWEESLRRPENVLFLRYEQMLEDPAGEVRRLAGFMGCPFSEAEEADGAPEDIVSLCSFQKLKELEVNKRGTLEAGLLLNDTYFRKGEKGDWRNHLTDEMAQRLDGIFRDQLKGRGDELYVRS